MPFQLRSLVPNLIKLFSSAQDYQAPSEILTRAKNIASVEDAADGLKTLLQWLLKEDDSIGRYTRLSFLFSLLERQPEFRKGLIHLLNLLACESSFQKLLLQTGYSDQHNLIDEIKFRMERRFLPSVEECDFYEVAFQAFQEEASLEWLRHLPAEYLEKIRSLILECEDLQFAFQESVKEALVILATQVANLGLTFQIRERSTIIRATKSPFLQLQNNVVNLVETREQAPGAGPGHIPEPEKVLKNCIEQCRQQLAVVTEDMESNGTSVALVYRLELLTDVINRLEKLYRALLQPKTATVHDLLTDAVEATHDSRSILSHISRSSHLLSRKIAERNGDSGERYISKTAEEKRELFVSSLQGGAVVLLMTVFKIAALNADFPPLLGFFIVWFIYSGGFLLMQFTHSTLATKLPSFTASRLARLLYAVKDGPDLDVVVTEFKALLKSQLVSFFGNIVALVPLALAFHFLLEGLLPFRLMGPESALMKLESYHPLFSWAVPMGVVTGVLLWMSSLGGGWFENWIVFRKIPRAIGENRRLRKLYGDKRSERVGHWIEKNASGIGANISLGFLFGFVPFVGAVIGVPLDSQHVTISSTTAVMAFAALPALDSTALFIEVIAGLLLIGVANLTVSFGLALFVAARATAIHPRRFKVLMKLLAQKLFQSSN